MSSACSLVRHLRSSIAESVRVCLAVAILASAAACDAPPAGTRRAEQAPQGHDTPIGPLPGPGARRLAPVENPYAGDEGALQQGRRFFVAYNCAGCHGDHGGGGMGPSLRDEAWIYGGTDGEIADSIKEGRAHGMPAWGRMLTEEQVWQIAAYLKSLRTPREPDPPVGS